MRPETDYENAAAQVREVGCVAGVDVLENDARLDRTVVEAIVVTETGRVPPAVLTALADAGLGVWDTATRPDGVFIVVAF